MTGRRDGRTEQPNKRPADRQEGSSKGSFNNNSINLTTTHIVLKLYCSKDYFDKSSISPLFSVIFYIIFDAHWKTNLNIFRSENGAIKMTYVQFVRHTKWSRIKWTSCIMIDYGLFRMIYKPSKLIYRSVHINRVYHFIRDHFTRIPLYT